MGGSLRRCLPTDPRTTWQQPARLVFFPTGNDLPPDDQAWLEQVRADIPRDCGKSESVLAQTVLLVDQRLRQTLLAQRSSLEQSVDSSTVVESSCPQTLAPSQTQVQSVAAYAAGSLSLLPDTRTPASRPQHKAPRPFVPLFDDVASMAAVLDVSSLPTPPTKASVARPAHTQCVPETPAAKLPGAPVVLAAATPLVAETPVPAYSAIGRRNPQQSIVLAKASPPAVCDIDELEPPAKRQLVPLSPPSPAVPLVLVDIDSPPAVLSK
jgi:hypothetical protein